jgi:uncharacterized damage-inducible protein DinB
VIRATKGLTQSDLDYLIDPNANTIGALMLHLAATDTYFHTFEGKQWGSWPDSMKQQWDAAMSLADAGRKTIKGHDRDYYLNILQETRAKTLAEFSKRDDTWLMAVDKDWPWGPTKNLCQWFHVCEHEAHHTGQIAFLKNGSLAQSQTLSKWRSSLSAFGDAQSHEGPTLRPARRSVCRHFSVKSAGIR